MVRIESLRRRLQNTTILAVLAGYAVLVAINVVVDRLQLQSQHQSLVTLLRMQVAGGEIDLSDPRSLQLPGGIVEAKVVPAQREHSPRMLHDGSQVFMVSVTRISLPNNALAGLEVREDVTNSYAHTSRSYLVLAVVSGISSLLTSILLRPVLRDGLVKPLKALSQAMASVPSAALQNRAVLIDPVIHPQELRSIISSFNDLQQRLYETWQLQRTFIDGVGHELRTPLTLIKGYAQRLSRFGPVNPASAAEHKQIQGIVSEADRATRLVRDLLDLARIDADQLELQLSPLDVAHVLLTTYERFENIAAGRLRLDLPPADLQPAIMADPDRLQQCLDNLLDNALKYAPAPTPVELSMSLESRGDGSMVVFHVRDHGPGVPEQDRRRIFELFDRGIQASVGVAATVSGSGIGLAMVRLLISRMGGSVSVSDAPGGGADFQLQVPLAKLPIVSSGVGS